MVNVVSLFDRGKQSKQHERVRQERLSQVRELIERLTYDIGKLIAGHPVVLDYCAPEVAAALPSGADTFLATGCAFYPNFGELGRLVIRGNLGDPHADVCCAVKFADGSVLESPAGNLLRTEVRMRGLYARISSSPALITELLIPEIPLTPAQFQAWSDSAAVATHPDQQPAEMAVAPATAPAGEARVDASQPSNPLPWAAQQCVEDGCLGVRAGDFDRCLAHLGEDERELELRRLSELDWLDLRGVRIDDALWGQVRQIIAQRAAPLGTLLLSRAVFTGYANLSGLRIMGAVDATDAVFEAAVDLRGADVGGSASFDRARMRQGVWLTQAHFANSVSFSHCEIGRGLYCDNARFDGIAQFAFTAIEGVASFTGAVFGDMASFRAGRIAGQAWFQLCRFLGPAFFSLVTFQAGACFIEAHFESEVAFDGAQFRAAPNSLLAWLFGAANFAGATFEGQCTFGPVLVHRSFVLDGVIFRRPLNAEISADVLSCVRTTFAGASTLLVRWAELTLDGAAFEEPSLLSGSDRTFGLDDRELLSFPSEEPLRRSAERPRLVSVRQANVGKLTVAHLDLSACRFYSAYNLDALRIEADVQFARSPVGRLRRGRRTLAEEQEWHIRDRLARKYIEAGADLPDFGDETTWRVLGKRIDSGRGRGWYRAQSRPPVWLLDVAPLDADRIAGIYRSLRKGREDNRDDPGAADFYIGEMEMRRQALQSRAFRMGRGHTNMAAGGDPRGGGVGELPILWFYWLTSGYGYSPARCLLWLGTLLGAFTALFWAFGLPAGASPVGWERIIASVLVCVESATSVVAGSSPHPLTQAGEIFSVVLRILSLPLIGLLVLSLRARIRR